MRDEQTTVLVVEDDPIAREFLAQNLVADGFRVMAAGGLSSARRRLDAASVDLVVLDLGLPDGDGLQLLDLLRGGDAAVAVDPDLPIVILSGRGGELDRLRGLRRGADDYVVKPFSYPELHARVSGVLRRASGRGRGTRLRVGPLDIDTITRQVQLDGEPIHLSPKEFGLLCALAADPVRVYTREELLRGVWGYQHMVPTRSLDAYACRLRRKLNRGATRFVVNVWGVGFKLLEGGA